MLLSPPTIAITTVSLVITVIYYYLVIPLYLSSHLLSSNLHESQLSPRQPVKVSHYLLEGWRLHMCCNTVQLGFSGSKLWVLDLAYLKVGRWSPDTGSSWDMWYGKS